MTGWVTRRTWAKTSVESHGSSFVILLDDNYLRTPKQNKVLLPTQKLADKVAQEWQEQKDSVIPSTMPYSRLVNSAIDKVTENFDAIVLDLLSYGDTDLVCYRAESPKDLVLLQQRHWDPILFWAKIELGISLKTTQGITYQSQDPVQRQKLFRQINSYDTFSLTGFYELVTISGSLLIAFAVHRNHISPESGLDLSFLDEDWQRKRWGEDEESIKNKANKLSEFQTAFNFLNLLA
ncbi:MAG: ATP12 family protein [Paracoccaceae bacterium]|nr:ATP12 family protein [Paracoccaceae bacterium]